MMKKTKLSRIALMLGLLAFVVGVSATNAFAAGPGTVTMTVTAVGKKDVNPPAVTKEDVQFFLNKERTHVANWRRGEHECFRCLLRELGQAGHGAAVVSGDALPGIRLHAQD